MSFKVLIKCVYRANTPFVLQPFVSALQCFDTELRNMIVTYQNSRGAQVPGSYASNQGWEGKGLVRAIHIIIAFTNELTRSFVPASLQKYYYAV